VSDVTKGEIAGDHRAHLDADLELTHHGLNITPGPAWTIYNEALTSAWKARNEANASAWKARDEAIASARKA
jgi:hypothetical protein